MKFCVLTLSYNQGDFLKDAIESVLNQSVQKEYLIYDPGSKDNSREVIDGYLALGVNSYFVDGDNGPADGLNVGLRSINGDIFYYLNADDRVLPGAFAYVKDYFLEHPQCDILHGSINLIDSQGRRYKTLPSIRFSLKGYAFGYSVIYQQATFIRKSILGEFPFNVGNRISWDGELIVDLVMNGAEIHQTKRILGEFRIYPESITGSRNFLEIAREEHSRIAYKILGRNPKIIEKIYALFVRYASAIVRRFFQNPDYPDVI